MRASKDERFVLQVNAAGSAPLGLHAADRSFGWASFRRWFARRGWRSRSMPSIPSIARARRSVLANIMRLLRVLRELPKVAIPRLREAHLRGRVHSRARDRAAIGFHYDQPPAFYRSFLDRELVYSCAYWDEGIDSLDAAQSAKLDYILRKLRCVPANGCSTSAAAGARWSFAPRSRERRRSALR